LRSHLKDFLLIQALFASANGYLLLIVLLIHQEYFRKSV